MSKFLLSTPATVRVDQQTFPARGGPSPAAHVQTGGAGQQQERQQQGDDLQRQQQVAVAARPGHGWRLPRGLWPGPGLGPRERGSPGIAPTVTGNYNPVTGAARTPGARPILAPGRAGEERRGEEGVLAPVRSLHPAAGAASSLGLRCTVLH